MAETRLKFRYVMILTMGIACFLLGLVTSLREPSPTLAIDEVLAMKPVEGDEQMFAEIPIEVVYGVPSKRTEKLWTHSKP